MISSNQKIIPFISFCGNAEEVMNFYISVFPDSKLISLTHTSKEDRVGEIPAGYLPPVFQVREICTPNSVGAWATKCVALLRGFGAVKPRLLDRCFFRSRW